MSFENTGFLKYKMYRVLSAYLSYSVVSSEFLEIWKVKSGRVGVWRGERLQ